MKNTNNQNNEILIRIDSKKNHVSLKDRRKQQRNLGFLKLDEKKDEVAFMQFSMGIKNKHTRRSYFLSLDRFMIFSKMDSYDKIVTFSVSEINSMIMQYNKFMFEQNFATNTLKNNLCGILTFFNMNDVLLNNKKLFKVIQPDEENAKEKSKLAGQKPYTTDEIKRLLGATRKLRTKAMILFFTSTGARPAVLWDPHLRMKHLVEMPHGCLGVHMYSDSNEAYWGFLTPEAVKALENYHNDRKFRGEKFTDETPMFSVKSGYPMGEYSGRDLIKRTIKLAGIEKNQINRKSDKPQFYAFRKRFNTILKNNNNVNANIAEKLMAHKRGLDGVYFQPTREEMFAEFYKAVPELTVDQTHRKSLQIAELKEKNGGLVEKTTRINELEDSMENLKQTLVGLIADADQKTKNRLTAEIFKLTD